MDSGRSSASRRTTLRERRLALGLSREGLAIAAGLSARTIYALEVEGVRPQRATIRVLADALGCQPNDLTTNARDPSVTSGRRRKGAVTAHARAYSN
jgi:DNA-binding XRE family transcriptional regulator